MTGKSILVEISTQTINVCGVDTVCPPTPQSPPSLGSTGGRGNSTFMYVPQGFMGIVYVFPFRKMSGRAVSAQGE